VEEQGTHKSKGARHILQVLLTPGTMVVRGKEGAIDEIRFKDILRCEPHESTDGEPTALRLQARHLFRASQPDLHAHPLQRLDVDPSSLRGVETLSLGSVPSVAAAPVLYTLSLSLFVLLTSRLAPEKPNRHGGRRGGRASASGQDAPLTDVLDWLPRVLQVAEVPTTGGGSSRTPTWNSAAPTAWLEFLTVQTLILAGVCNVPADRLRRAAPNLSGLDNRVLRSGTIPSLHHVPFLSDILPSS